MAFYVSELLGDTHPQGVHFTEINLINPKQMVHHILNRQPNARLGGGDPIFFKCLLRKRTFFKQVSFCTLKIHKHREHKHI